MGVGPGGELAGALELEDGDGVAVARTDGVEVGEDRGELVGPGVAVGLGATSDPIVPTIAALEAIAVTSARTKTAPLTGAAERR